MSFRKFGFSALALALGAFAPAQIDAAVTLPNDNDEYSKLVARANAEDQSIDFRALRFAYFKSAARKRTNLPGMETGDMQKEMFAAMGANDDARVRNIAEKIIDAEYINMYGHKGLRQACEHLHDDACARREHFIEFGLLTSIMHSGDGKTCPTGWEVVSVAEEYFVLAMAGARLQNQALIGGSPSCDAMTVTGDDGATHTHFFRIDAVLADEAAELSGH